MTRKFTFLLMALLALAGFKSWGQQALPYSYGFENNDLAAAGWRMVNYSPENAGEFGIFTDAKHNGSYGFRFSSYAQNNSGNYNQYLISPQISASSEFVLQFYYAKSDPWGAETFRVGYSTTGNQPDSFIYGEDIQVNSQEWSLSEEFVFPAETKYVAIHYHSNYQYRLYVDDFTFMALNSCPKPTGLTASNITATGATISWNDDGAETYDLAYGVASSFDLNTPGTYTLVTGLDETSVQLSGLTTETEYKCAVKAHCSDEEESAWSSAVTFTPSAKTTLTVNDGTDSNERVPFWGYNADHNTQSQFIIPANQIEDLAGGTISDLTFYVSLPDNEEFTYNQWKVYVKEVDETSVGYAYIDFGSMTEVYSGGLSIVDNKLVVHFNTPYVYNSSKNLMIGFNQTNNFTWASTSWLGKNEGTEMRSRGGYGGNHASYVFLPKTTFTYIPGATYTVILTQPEAGGTIDADPKTDVTAGTTVTLSATPATGYELGEWTVTNVTTSETVTVTNNTFEMPDSDVNVTATFEALVPHTVSIAEGIQHGTVSLFPDAPQEYMAGATVYLDVTADDGYFYPREGEITVTDADGNNIDVFINGTDYSFIMPNSDVTVWAVFNLYYGVQVDTEIVGGHIDVTDDLGHSISGIPFFTAGADVYFIPIPGDDYEYVEQSVSVYEWDLEQHEIGNPIDVDYNSGFAHITMPESHIFVTATFNRIRYSVTQQITNPAGSGYFYIENAEHIEVGTPVVISYIEAYWDYQFASVTITRNDDQTTVEAYPYYGDYVFYMPDSDVTVTVNFEKIPSYTVTIDETEHGTVSIYGAESSYHAGEVVSLVADPDEGYIISATEITITPAEGDPFHPTYDAYNSVYNFYMPASNVTITAAFREIQTYTINYYVNGELEGSAQCSEIEAIDIHAYYPYVSGVLFFEGWSVAPIGTYLTDKPAIIGEDEHPTHDYDLHAVFSYSETLPATSKDGETWVEVTSPTDLSNGDQVIIVSGNFVMCDRSSSGSGEFPQGSISIYNNEITELPDNAVILTAIEFPEFWQFYFNDAFNGYSGLADYIGSYLVPSGAFGTDCSTWVIEQNGSSVAIKDTQFESYITLYSNRFTCSSYGAKAQLFKKYNPFITNTYYMTSVLTDGEVAENTTAKNIIISSINNINVKDGATLTMDANGLFRNELFSNFVFEDGAQFYYTGTETVNATFEKEISGYAGDNDNYYLIANPTDYNLVGNLYDNLYDLYTFNPEETLEWQNEHDNRYVEQRIGYLYANSEDITLQFTGNLTPAGETEIALVKAEAVAGIEFPGFNLIGNPYACNAYVDGYNFYKMVGGELQTAVTSATIAPCEGFFVEATAAGQSVTLSTTAPEAPASMLNITVSQNRGNVIDRAIVNFDGRSDLHKFMMNPNHTNIRLAKNGEEFAAVSAGSTSGEIPVSFKAEKNGCYTITVNTENVNAHYIHLIDNLTGADVDLLATPSYTFNASTTDYAYRFKLVFSMTDIEENESNANSFAYISNGNLVIDNIEGEATMQIIDMLGRVVSTETVSGSYNKALGLNAGLYIINLNGTTQKIVVK